jgi:hypothetical protein
MTEAEWLACDNPRRMLEFLRGKASERKMRLYACTYSLALRATERLGPGSAVTVAERYADGLAGDQDLASARRGAPFPDNYSSWVVAPSAYEGAWQAADYLTSARDLIKIDPDEARCFGIPVDDIVKRLVFLLRDMFGNPFRRLPLLDPAWLAWNDAAIPKMARSIYEARTFDRLPLLADALEDAGCADAGLLAHCREPGEHVRGCWVVDLLLGKT